MDNQEWLDIYTDYQINSFGLTTGTGLLRLLDGAISHDRLQRLLASPTKGGKDLWKVVKRYVREIQAADGALIVDDSIAEKPPTQTVTTQSKHFFTSLCAYIRLEMLKVTTQTHHFALKSKLHLCALRHGF